MITTNEQRADLGYRTLLVFMQHGGSSKGDALCDLLADLMHYADSDGADFDTELERAREHYQAEIDEERAS